MKVNRLETHDRFEYFTQQSFGIGKTCQDIINQRPFGEYAFYIFAHKRQIGMDERIAIFDDDLRNSLIDLTYVRKYNSLSEVPTDRLIWQPRLTKPKAQENSMLFKGYPGSDNVKILWMIPAREMWDQYSKGKMLENKTVVESINMFKTDPAKLEMKEDDDLPDVVIDRIYREMSMNAKRPKYGMI